MNTRYSLNGYVAIANGIQDTKLNAQTKLCSAKHEKDVRVSNG